MRIPEPGPTSADPSNLILKGRVLLVDDEPLLLSLFGRVLRSAGYAVQEVSDARCVADILARHRFDVVVSDLVMPMTDGQKPSIAFRKWDARFAAPSRRPSRAARSACLSS